MYSQLCVKISRNFRNKHHTKILAFVGEVGAEYGINVPDSEVGLAFMKSGYLIGIYIPMIRGFDLEKYTRKPFGYKRKVERVFATDRSASLGDKVSSSVLMFGGSADGDGLWSIKILL